MGASPSLATARLMPSAALGWDPKAEGWEVCGDVSEEG